MDGKDREETEETLSENEPFGKSGHSGQNNEWHKSSASGDRTSNAETQKINSEKPPKRKRGRPRKTEQTTIGITSEKVETSEGKEEKRRGRPPKNASFMSEEEANNTTEFILSMIETSMIGIYGEEAAFTFMEKVSLTASLPKLLTGLKISTVENAKSFLFPIMGLLAFSVYGMRIMKLATEKRENENLENTVVQETNTGFSTNGDKQEWNNEQPINPFIQNFTMNKSRGL